MESPVLQVLSDVNETLTFWPAAASHRWVIVTELADDNTQFIAYGVDVLAERAVFKLQGTVSRLPELLERMAYENAIVVDLRVFGRRTNWPVQNDSQLNNSPPTYPPGNSVLPISLRMAGKLDAA